MTAFPSPQGIALFDEAAQRRIEAEATAALGGDAFVLMSRAGQAAWRELLRHWPDAMRIVVLCGPGNNGGDGYVLARHALESGRDVRVLRLAAHAPRSGLAQRACREYEQAGGRVEEASGAGFGDADLVVDALFGIGLWRAPDADTAALIAAANASGLPVFALDVPSGVDAGRGSVPGAAIVATHTLQFIAPHAGLYTGAARDHTGTLAVATLDVPQELVPPERARAFRLVAGALGRCFPPRPRNAHKGLNGHVLCIGGDSGKGGAVMMCAEAALRSGAGLVSVATREAHVPALLARCPEAMVQGVSDASELAPLFTVADVVAVGPGLGCSPWGRAMFEAAVASGRPLVVDADALNLLAQDPRALPAHSVLTPHPGEAARLLGTGTVEVQANRYAAVRLLCEQTHCTVVLKGAGTLVAAPGEAPRVIDAGNPGMAVGGMGDVLTGVIAALRAQGFPAFAAACAGALLHAVAGDDAARDGGERGLLPRDLFPYLRRRANGAVHG